MIYLVSKQQELFDNDIYRIITVEESLKLLEPLKKVGLDTETEGLDPYTKKLKSIQLGCHDFQVVVDTLTIDPILYKEYLESDRLFIGWNLKFDLKFLYHQRIVPKKVWDGFLAEKLMWLGYPAGIHSLSLKSAGENYLGIELDKSVRGKIIWAGLTADVIEYSANDVKYLEQIMDKQIEELKKKDLMKAIEYENRFVLPLAYCEYCGVRLDVDKWKAKMAKDEQREKEALDKCNKWVEDYYNANKGSKDLFIETKFVFETDSYGYHQSFTPNGRYEVIGPLESYVGGDSVTYYSRLIRQYFPFVKVNLQGDLFSGFDTGPKCCINWNSAKQLIPLFRLFGVDVEVQDKERGGTKDSIDAKCLKPQKDKCSLIPIYLNYKEAVKVTSTYGENFLKQINSVSNRIHTNYSQMGADTTRITSGGKDKEHHTEYVNLLNLPSDAETRACFCAESGNRWISIDYSGQETYLMASIANDRAIIKELTEGSGDIHSLTAYMSYHEIPRDTPIKDIKKLYHDLRQEAKGIEFAINYGGNADTIARNKGIPVEEANKIYNAYMSGFKGLKAYQDFRRKDWFAKGYILLNPLTGHKAFIYDYDKLLEDKKWMQNLDWEYYREMKRDCPNCDTVERVRHFFKRKSASEKQSINYPIQATGSMCLRVTLIYFFNWLRDNDLLFKVKICIPPYDEVNCEAPEEAADIVTKSLYNCMVKAGAFFCRRCKLDADISWAHKLDEDGKEILDEKGNPIILEGVLPNYWIH